MVTSTGEPENLQEALGGPKLIRAMHDEINALMRNQTWHLVQEKKGMNLIDCEWVYKVKKKADGMIDRYKA